MTPKPFNPIQAARMIALLGYHHVDRETDMEAVQEFAANNALAIEDVGAMCTVTLVPAGQKASGTDWERIRTDRLAKRIKSAERAKKKEATK